MYRTESDPRGASISDYYEINACVFEVILKNNKPVFLALSKHYSWTGE